MRGIFHQLQSIVALDSENPSDHLNKMTEEVGELAKEINRLSGRKKRDGLSNDQINKNIEDELADVMQIAFSIAHCCNIDYESLKNTMRDKNEKYKTYITDQILKES